MENLNERQQIEEMAKAMCGNGMANGSCAMDDEPCNLECVYGCCAEKLYAKGYRKQSEGEWYVNYMMSKKPSKRGRIIQYTTYTCSVCGKPNGRKKSKFCPECGAKMKGGAE